MDNPEGGKPQKTPEELQAEFATQMAAKEAELAAERKKAEVSSQNFERAKKAEEKLKEAEAKLAEKGDTKEFNPDQLRKEVDMKVDLRLAGYEPEHIAEIEKYAKGAGISIAEAAKLPFVQKAVDGLKADKKSTDNTPAPSNKVRVFNGKPVDEVFKTGTPAEKQAAWEATVKGRGPNQSE